MNEKLRKQESMNERATHTQETDPRRERIPSKIDSLDMPPARGGLEFEPVPLSGKQKNNTEN